MRYRNLLLLLSILLCALLLGKNAREPVRFTGTWYTSEGHGYEFQQGIITGPDGEFAGAYQFTRKSITLFLTGHPLLDDVTTLYWTNAEDCQVLQTEKRGQGSILFSR